MVLHEAEQPLTGGARVRLPIPGRMLPGEGNASIDECVRKGTRCLLSAVPQTGFTLAQLSLIHMQTNSTS